MASSTDSEVRSEPVETVHVGAQLEADTRDALRQIAEVHDRSLSAEVRRAIRQYVDKHRDEEAA